MAILESLTKNGSKPVEPRIYVGPETEILLILSYKDQTPTMFGYKKKLF